MAGRPRSSGSAGGNPSPDAVRRRAITKSSWSRGATAVLAATSIGLAGCGSSPSISADTGSASSTTVSAVSATTTGVASTTTSKGNPGSPSGGSQTEMTLNTASGLVVVATATPICDTSNPAVFAFNVRGNSTAGQSVSLGGTVHNYNGPGSYTLTNQNTLLTLMVAGTVYSYVAAGALTVASGGGSATLSVTFGGSGSPQAVVGAKIACPATN